jgi:dihydrofolate reductase
MGKVLYGAAMSLDGFIAGASGEMSWPAEHTGPNPVAGELIARTGAVLVGARTFWGDDPHRGTEAEGKAFGGGWEGPRFVLTHNPPAEPVPGATFVGDLDTGLAAAKAAAGGEGRQRARRRDRALLPGSGRARRGGRDNRPGAAR